MTPELVREALKTMSLVDTARHFQVGDSRLATFMRRHGIRSPRAPGRTIRQVDNLGVEGRRKGGRKGYAAVRRAPNGFFAPL